MRERQARGTSAQVHIFASWALRCDAGSLFSSWALRYDAGSLFSSWALRCDAGPHFRELGGALRRGVALLELGGALHDLSRRIAHIREHFVDMRAHVRRIVTLVSILRT